MRKENSDFNTKFISEAGSYLVNADYFAFVELKDYACYVIADGIDPDEKKESAKLAVTTVITEFSDAPGMSAGKLRHYLKSAHEALLRESDEIRLEASILILLTDYKKAMWGHAGNSRLCWIKNGEIKLSTKDTSLTQRMADQEEVALDQISAHEERNNLYTYLGQPGHFTPVISAKHKLEDGDIFILMTRGVWENVGNAEIIDAVDGVSKAEDVCTGLEDVILSQRLDIIENYTIASVFINKIYQNPKAGRNKKILRIVFAVCMALGMLTLSLTITKYSKNKSNLNKMLNYKKQGIEQLMNLNLENATKHVSEAYATSQNITATKKSKTGKQVEIVVLYNSMLEYMNTGEIALGETNFKKANTQFGHAVSKLNEMKDLGEDVSAFEKGVLAYQTFAENMQKGVKEADENDLDEAQKAFEQARDVMEEVDGIKYRDAAQVMVNACMAQKYVNTGKEYERQGDANARDYDIAKVDYVTAKDYYDRAAALDKSSTAATYSEEVLIKIRNIESKIESMTDEQWLKKAETYIADGDKAAREGDKEAALAAYNKAIELYANVRDQATTNVAQLKASVNEKIGNLDSDPSQELLSAIDCLSREDYSSAIDALNRAKDLYNMRGDKASAQMIGTYINNVKGLANRQE